MHTDYEPRITLRSPMHITSPTTEGFLDGPHGATWWRITAAAHDVARRAPLVVLHGGPGFTHDYLLRLTRIAATGRDVIHYDQIGAGRSTHLPDADPRFWTVDLFLDELDRLLQHLDIADNYVLLGQSWGGMLAAEHAIRQPMGLRALVLANSPASMELWCKGVRQLRSALPASVQAVLTEHETADTTDSIEYLDACTAFYDKHVCRQVPNPDDLRATFAALEADPTVYHAMCGPNEFHVVGSLADWSVVDQLDQILTPTLLLSGEHDEATDTAVAPIAQHVPGATWIKFANSSHMPHIEEEDRFLDIVSEFLNLHDS